ncbi:NeuD/PglB/VioB family sugar acetyltransferase [Marivirga arenosa]|uniref:NeuD/PglB/VioB family sugar acetyltransferase n=1 Tax=Marivirga arenosa TaxID=3059076 RepID=A0AA49GHN8_9BACT|nr:NeuD/PglB/VioB family sugar acetyltransferase [Marivirga sp. ABR2-2]WKK84638.2 NeuD/PglB/VioB family sugar acetyltransferase [Marivirga sp. ABR2-2]
MTEIAIFGAGGFGREVNLIIQQLIKKGHPLHFLGYFDDEDKSAELGQSYLGNLEDLNNWNKPISIAVAVGNGLVRKEIVNKITNPKVDYARLISPYAIFNDIIEVGKGSIVCAGANLTTNISIGNFTVINLNATIGHDCILSDFCSIMPGVNLAGNVELEKGVFVGSGANILNGVRMKENSVLGSGAVLINDLAANEKAVGVPAKTIRK